MSSVAGHPSKRLRVPALLVGLLLASLSPTTEARAADGPAIGVLLYRKPESLELETRSDDKLLLELQSGSRLIPGGKVRLTFREDAVQVGTLVLRNQPFRLRAEPRGLTRVQGRDYEGWLEILPDRPNWRVVNRLPMERYLEGVLSREVPEWFEPAALEAQAIASRTYATFQILSRPAQARHHVSADVSSQVYGGFTRSEEMRSAVARTHGQVMLHENKIFEAYFHSTCGGATFRGAAAIGAPDIEPLQGVPCGHCQPSKFYRWKDRRIPETKIRTALDPLCRKNQISLGKILRIEPVERGLGRHAAFLRIEHTDGSFEIDSDLFRRRVGANRLLSVAFDCAADGDDFVFDGQGWGHGVGMCQFGVNGLAKEGYDAVAIVEYYYRGARVVELWK